MIEADDERPESTTDRISESDQQLAMLSMKKLSPSITRIPPSKRHGIYTYFDSSDEMSPDTQSLGLSSAVDSEIRREVAECYLSRGPLTIEKQKADYKRQARPSCIGSSLGMIVSGIVGVVLFIFVLSTLVISKLSFLIMTQQFNDTRSPSVNESVDSLKTKKAAEFWRLLIALVIPSLFSFLRCLWSGLISRTKRHYPWPNKLAILAGFVTSVLESVALCIFTFIVAARIPHAAITITLMSGVFGFTIVSQLLHIRNADQGRNMAEGENDAYGRNYNLFLNENDNGNEQQQNVREEYELIEMREIWKENRNQTQPGWEALHIKLGEVYKRYRTVATWIALSLHVGSIAILVILLCIFNSNFHNNRWVVLTSIPIVLGLLSIVWCSPVQKYLNIAERNPSLGRPIASARWKNGILTNFWRMISLTTVAIIMSAIPYADLNVDVDYLGKGLAHLRNTSGNTFFLVNVFCTWGAYVLSWFACTIRKGTIGFIWPLLLATPVAIGATFGVCSNDQLNSAIACTGNLQIPFYEHGLVPICLFLLWISQMICCVFYVWRTKLIALIKEENLFIQSYYNCPFTEQNLMLNRIAEFDDEKVRNPKMEALDSHVFVCTTMYREQLHEQKMLLTSIHVIDEEQVKNKSRNFECHVFFDGGAKGCHTTEYANQLFSLLHDTLLIRLSDGEKWETPYGLQIKWNLPGGMPFCVHLKDSKKVKRKKRWSQVMYLSYILDFRSRESNYKDDNTFVLMTDADSVFDFEAVEIVLDRLCRDQLVGGVCGRVHPVGSGPIVWYQKFDYAVGHWFQKVTEHVLGSVMCCPGCFSVFRAPALRDVLPEYATKAETAKEFLMKDMGEDRWLCTLLVEEGWLLEYAAAADSYTFCPDSFNEFYKQRRRWTVSTMANLMQLCFNSAKVIGNNDAVFIIFILYQAAMIFSTIVAPATVILVMAAGMTYAFNTSSDYDNSGAYIAFVVLFTLVSFIYGVVCILCQPDTQLKMAKIMTFIFSILMGIVVVGVMAQIVIRLEGPEAPTPTTFYLNSSSLTQANNGISLEDVALSTCYLAGLLSIFFVAALLHPTEFFCLFHSLWYLLCLPSGYLCLIIYSICNLNSDSWGTRETVKQNTEELRSVKVEAISMTDDETVTPNSRSVEVQTISVKDGDDDENVTQTNSDLPSRVDQTESEDRASTAVISIRRFFANIGLKNTNYAEKFEAVGYADTSFFIKMKEKDIRSLGVTKTADVKVIMMAIDELPDTSVPRRVPNNVSDWLLSIGLPQYEEQFARAGCKGECTLASLITLDRDILENEVGVTKEGHLKKLEMALKMIKYPADCEVAIIKAKSAIDGLDKHRMADSEDRKVNLEYDFWNRLQEKSLIPESDEYKEGGKIKQNLNELRNKMVFVFAVTNITWIVLISMLGFHANLSVFLTNALGFLLLAVYGLIFLVQFLALICHRIITVIHYLAHKDHSSSKMPIAFDIRRYPPTNTDHPRDDGRVLQPMSRNPSTSSTRGRKQSNVD
ncbi:uncharacterized protein LOC134198189 isoform X2 [Corticium candelabrum]|uniref:uncharacterized protein LOC134198189 isoform X2 n=1 Tax=Corticium candelabrum TaxID=121492 RepID=UPI002E26AE71|nr:uncharacterized protein LOC134198189 isoform X2 [Corticium candelabrum]